MRRIAGQWYDSIDLPPHCPQCRATEGHEPGCRHWEPRGERYEPAPCAPHCELSYPGGEQCTCGNADQCPDCEGSGMTIRGPYERACEVCDGRGHV